MTNQQHEEQQSHSAAHPNALVNHIAHSIGFNAARTYLRIQSITHTAHKEVDRPDRFRLKIKQTQLQPSEQESGQDNAQAEELNQPATRKAEAMVDNLTQRLSSLTATAKLNFQKTAHRAREDFEDIWAEAQNIRHHPH